MLDVAIRRFALRCLLAGFVGPGASGWLDKGVGGVGLFGSNTGDGTWPARLAGEIRSAGPCGVGRPAGSDANKTRRVGALRYMDNAAASGAIGARRARVAGSLTTALAACRPHADAPPESCTTASADRGPYAGVLRANGSVDAIYASGRSLAFAHDANRHRWPRAVRAATMRHPGHVILDSGRPTTPVGVPVAPAAGLARGSLTPLAGVHAGAVA